ncbi:hypothetical protein HL666_27205 [Bradyrhizobium sp. 83002]|uniref:hypothetical protein n=1 Tax=Bradyrhizobium aeschynomenes TaxID=2734909 RepID=UPI0015537F0A|nr:hypothetical protein [Bradyrhizobium aeschynomenes]NPU14464.1 hypothetical protein [Bradyrhizobium aeschynomenes]NPV20518.1 hypothetical protein [Bradyrhizobium aeschynomenes]
MLTIDHEDGRDGAEQMSCSLVPLSSATSRDRRGHVSRAARPDAGFIAHLIATAEQLPQTRTLRRAAPADVHNAYAARLHPVTSASPRTRQVI